MIMIDCVCSMASFKLVLLNLQLSGYYVDPPAEQSEGLANGGMFTWMQACHLIVLIFLMIKYFTG